MHIIIIMLLYNWDASMDVSEISWDSLCRCLRRLIPKGEIICIKENGHPFVCGTIVSGCSVALCYVSIV